MKIMICAAGTGGHIYPGLSLARRLKKLKHDVSFIGSTTRMEASLIPSAGFKFTGLKLSNLNGFINKLKALFAYPRAYFKCKKILKDYDLIISFGNYISLPVVLAAKHLKKKIVIHEQNLYPGKANLLLEKHADLVITSMQGSNKYFKNPNTKCLGNPQSGLNKEDHQTHYFTSDKFKVLIFFGSLGSSSLDNRMRELFKYDLSDFEIIYACGKNNYPNYYNFTHPNVKVYEVIDGYSAILDCDLLISRSGASTIAEIISASKLSILIPSPYVANNHQYYNAKELSDQAAAFIIEEKQYDGDQLYNLLVKLKNNPEMIKNMTNGLDNFKKENALDDIVKEVLEL